MGGAAGGAGAVQSTALHVDATDVVKVVLQFLRENGLQKAFAAMEEETGVCVDYSVSRLAGRATELWRLSSARGRRIKRRRRRRRRRRDSTAHTVLRTKLQLLLCSSGS